MRIFPWSLSDRDARIEKRRTTWSDSTSRNRAARSKKKGVRSKKKGVRSRQTCWLKPPMRALCNSNRPQGKAMTRLSILGMERRAPVRRRQRQRLILLAQAQTRTWQINWLETLKTKSKRRVWSLTDKIRTAPCKSPLALGSRQLKIRLQSL